MPGRISRPHRRAHRVAPRWRAALVAVTLTAAAGFVAPFVPAAAAGARSARPATVTPLVRPNVVLILTDDQTPDAIAKMPYVNSRPDWIRFPNTYIENGLCCPSRSTILKGQYDTHTGVGNNGQTAGFNDAQTLGVWLHNAGYATAFVGKYLNNYPQAFNGQPLNPFVPPGWDDWQVSYGLITTSPTGSVLDSQYNGYNFEFSDNGTHVHVAKDPNNLAGTYQANYLVARAKTFVAAHPSQPFFLYYAPTSTHGPWIASPSRTGMFANAPVAHRPDLNEQDVSDKPAYIRQMPLSSIPTVGDADRRKLWAASVSVDDTVRALDQQLKDSGVYDNTVEIFLSDQGYAFGEHRWHGKQCEYTECNNSPMYVRYPGHPAASYSATLSNADLASTITAIAGTTPAIPQDGQSFLPLILGGTMDRPDGVLLHWPGTWHGVPTNPGYVPEFWGVRTRQYLYVELTGVSGIEKELYDNQKDPYQLTNVAGKPAYAAIQTQLAARLATLKAAAQAKLPTS